MVEGKCVLIISQYTCFRMIFLLNRYLIRDFEGKSYYLMLENFNAHYNLCLRRIIIKLTVKFAYLTHHGQGPSHTNVQY